MTIIKNESMFVDLVKLLIYHQYIKILYTSFLLIVLIYNFLIIYSGQRFRWVDNFNQKGQFIENFISKIQSTSWGAKRYLITDCYFSKLKWEDSTLQLIICVLKLTNLHQLWNLIND